MKKAISILLVFTLCLGMVAASTSCHKRSRNTGDDADDENTIQISEGEDFSLDLEGDSDDIKWKSKDKNIATVDKDGNIVAGEPGETEIIVEKNGKTYRYKVKIEGKNDKKTSDKDKKEDKKDSKDTDKKADSKKDNKDKEEDMTVELPNNSSPVLYANKVKAKAGDEVEVEVGIARNPGILGMVISIYYDEDNMVLKNATCGSALKGVLDFTKAKSYESGCNFVWDGVEINENQIKDGAVLTLTFEVIKSAKAGKYPIEIDYEEGDIVNGKLIEVEPDIVNGMIIIK